MSRSLKKHFDENASVFELKKFLLLNRVKQKFNPAAASEPQNLKRVAVVKQQVAYLQKKGGK